MAYEDAFAAAPHVRAARPRPARASWSSSRPASPAGRSCSRVAHEYLDPLAAAGVDTLILGCTHYPLLTGVISYVMGDGVTLVPAPRRPPRTSTGCWSSTTWSATGRPAGAGAPVRDHRGRRASSPPSPAGSWAPRWLGAASSRGRPLGARMRLDRRRLLRRGSPGRTRPRPATCSRPTAAGVCERRTTAAPGGSCSTSAAGRSARSSATSTRTSVDAVLLTHLHADHCLDLSGLYVAAEVPAPARAPDAPTAIPVVRVPSRRRPTGWRARLRPADRPGHDGRVRLPRLVRRRAGRDRPVHGDAARRSTTRSRPTACGSRPTGRCSPTPVTRPLPGLDAAVPRGADLILADSAFVEGRDEARAACT